ncbi:MAG: aminotransferase class I/II-fold pyridoxal phosphate-dependent enzyme [Gammaproteobacteria bacterium]|nr:aminotransferase class I/II-fold pyridoxal phosphate-dependent enzyme [Gammaproteobacteria bacterium]NND37223.1 aminotransferase class I/II-fold pyridoxal phosphate-dependent enzyme [Gammaproteobacteria bacterium]
MQKSATLAINERSAELRAQGVDVIRLGLGQSPFPIPPSVIEALRRNAHQKAYLPVEGLPELRAAIAGYLERSEGIDVEPGQVIVGPGTKELMFLLQLAFDAELVLPAPSWVSYAPQARINQRQVRWLQTRDHDQLRVTPDALDALCSEEPGKSRLLILNYPGNPTGTSYGAKALQDIAAVARRHGVIVLSDEIYSGLNFAGDHVSLARYYPEGTIVSNGLSKWCGAGGWRLGAFVFPRELDWLKTTIAAAASETFSAVSAPIQHAAVVAFDGNDEIDDYLSRSRRLLCALMTTSARRLRDAGATVPEPQGGFYLLPRFADDCPRFRRGRPDNAAKLCESILEDTGVAILPGGDFGMAPERRFIRLAAVDFDGEAALDRFDDLEADALPDEAFLRAHCARTMTGIDRLCDWIEDRGQD